MLHYFQKENFNMWVTSGSHPDCSVGQVGQQVQLQPTFTVIYTVVMPGTVTVQFTDGYTLTCTIRM